VLARLEALVDASGIAGRIEPLLPVGVRSRQLEVRTLVLGMLLCQADHRAAHLTRVHAALVGLGDADRVRLGVSVRWASGPHTLTYRQVERTWSLLWRALATPRPDATGPPLRQGVLDDLLEASVADHAHSSASLALDWTDVESFSTRRTKPDGTYADKDAAWGHRKGGGPGEKDELFFGYYCSLATMVADDPGPAVPELVRRMNVVSCAVDPVPPMVEVVVAMARSGITLGDVVCDSGYAHRVPEHFALPLRAAGATLVIDLHPHDRGTQGTHQGAICWNGNLYCPATPPALFDLGALPRGASKEQAAVHDARVQELSRYKLGRVSATDHDGYHRVACPAVMGKLRCPRRPTSMTLELTRPEVAAPPEHRPTCCTQQTLTVAPAVNAKTAQRHDYLSMPWRRSYARRSAAERANARIKDPATIDVGRGWCRLMGVVPMSVWLCCALVVRNLGVADAFDSRQREGRRRSDAGLVPRTRRRRRTTLASLAGPTADPPP
jgi:hypothetical protein